MHKLISALTALSLVAALASGASAEKKNTKSMGTTMRMSPAKEAAHCAKMQTWVKPYTKKNGTKVKGYCR